METLEQIIPAHPFLRGMDPDQHRILIGCAYNVTYDPGRFIFREGGHADRFYLIQDGRVSVETQNDGRPIVVQTMGAGDVLGWSWIIPPHEWRFDARALELTHAVALDGNRLRAKCEDDTEFGYRLLKRMAHVLAVERNEMMKRLVEMERQQG